MTLDTRFCLECRHLWKRHTEAGCCAKYSAFQGRIYRCKCRKPAPVMLEVKIQSSEKRG